MLEDVDMLEAVRRCKERIAGGLARAIVLVYSTLRLICCGRLEHTSKDRCKEIDEVSDTNLVPPRSLGSGTSSRESSA